ncbi:hypothetical protein MLD38_039767 [Melastoma candidum]|uniref:Uncharacterized protein n=1 Tax=Melastoma candidum TaxID=119954 RepID=A0ACB9L4C0_9MYRT|nr:hypothetical protein MLD38_039767 [Melastoma candidum]
MSDNKVLLTYKRKRVSATSSLPHEDGAHCPHLKGPAATLQRTSDKSQLSDTKDASVEQCSGVARECCSCDAGVSSSSLVAKYPHIIKNDENVDEELSSCSVFI